MAQIQIDETISEMKDASDSTSSLTNLSAQTKIDKDATVLNSLLNISFLNVDYKTGLETNNPQTKWKVHRSRDKKVNIIYRKMDNANVYTLRSCMDIECNINDIYDYFDCEYCDDLKLILKYDKMMTSYNVSKVYNNNRCLIHATFTTGIPKSLVKPRDLCYIRKRFKYDNYNGEKVLGLIGYSVDSTHVDFVDNARKHIRGWMHYFGVIMVQKSENVWTINYIVCLDPCGKLPKAVVNICAPAQGMNVKKFANHLDEIKALLIQRKDRKMNVTDSNTSSTSSIVTGEIKQLK